MKKLEEFRCIVSLIDGKLNRCSLQVDGSPEWFAGQLNWQEVRGPLDPNFLKATNQALGTSFTLEDFQHKKSK